MQHFLVKVDHYYFGWFVFVFALGLYLYLSSRVPRRSRKEPSSMPPGAAGSRGRVAVLTVLSLAALALGPAWSLAGSWPGSTAHRA